VPPVDASAQSMAYNKMGATAASGLQLNEHMQGNGPSVLNTLSYFRRPAVTPSFDRNKHAAIVISFPTAIA